MDVSQLISSFGNYYLKEGQGKDRLVQKIRKLANTDEVMTLRLTDETLYRASESSITSILQPFQKAFTPKGQLKFIPIEIPLNHYKIDFTETPDDLEESWLGFLADENLSRAEWPIVRWLIEAHILPQIASDYEANEVWKGKKVAPTAGTAGANGSGMDGLDKQRKDQIAGGRITPFVMGAIPAADADFVKYVEDFVKRIPEEVRAKGGVVSMNASLEARYKTGYRTLYGAHNDFKGVGAAVIDQNFIVKGLTSMQGSTVLFSTPKGNLLNLAKKSKNLTKVRIEEAKREVAIMTDFYKGAGMLIPEYFFTNDLETTYPATV